MNVSSCMSRDVEFCAPSDTIQRAARTMRQIDAGILPVGENDRLVGMITDRDIAVRAIAEGRGPDTSVSDIMSHEVCYCFDDEATDDVAAQMGELQVRRLPVLNREKRLVGIISLGDLSHAIPDATGRALDGVATAGGAHTQ